MKKVSDGVRLSEHDLEILKDFCRACSERHLPEFLAGKFCMEDYCPGLLAQLASMKPIPMHPAMYTFKEAVKGLQELSNTCPNAFIREIEISRPVVEVPLTPPERCKNLYKKYESGDMMYITLSVILNEGGPTKRNWKYEGKE